MQKKTEAILGEINKTLREQRAELKSKDAEAEECEELKDDSVFLEDYRNCEGFIQGLEYAISCIKRLDKQKRIC